MVNNATNLQKRDGNLSPQINECRPQHVALEIQAVAWDKHNIWSGYTGWLIPQRQYRYKKQVSTPKDHKLSQNDHSWRLSLDVWYVG